MKFSSALVVAAALSLANAAAFTNNADFFQGITAGKSYNLTWTLALSGPVNILLKNGPRANLQTVAAAPALTGITGTSALYTIPATLPDDTYAFEIDETGAEVNYSTQFVLTGGAASMSSTGTASTTSTVTGSSTSTISSSSASAAANSTSSTTASKTTSASTSKTGTATATSASSTPSGLNSASGLASPLAFVFLAVAAVMTLQ